MLAIGFPKLKDLVEAWASRELRGATISSAAGESPQVGAIGAVASLAQAVDGDSKEWIPLTSLPVTAITEAKWFRVLKGSWRWAEHINYGEGRGALI